MIIEDNERVGEEGILFVCRIQNSLLASKTIDTSKFVALDPLTSILIL